MYLSRLKFDPTHRQVIKELANRYELHRTLCSQFSDIPREDIGLLYRIEASDPYKLEPIIVLAQTSVEPNWEKLYEKGLLVERPEVKAFTLHFTKGELFHFRLLANPTARRKEGEYAGKRVGLLKTEEQEAWLRRKGISCGFLAGDVQLVEMGNVVSSKMIDGKKATLTQTAVLFNGILQVTDAETFLETVRRGIGSAKAFGFGLLSLA